MQNSGVIIKGSRDCLNLHVASDVPFEDVVSDLIRQIDSPAYRNFFKNAKMQVRVLGRSITSVEWNMIKSVLTDRGLTVLAGPLDDRTIRTEQRAGKEVEEYAPGVLHEIMAPNAQIFEGTVRSGNKIESPYSVVVIGDVNPGAEIVSYASIYVFGKLRGRAHAGAAGDRTACIVARKIDAPQLAIADCIAQRGSDEDLPPPSGYEIARIAVVNSTPTIEISEV